MAYAVYTDVASEFKDITFSSTTAVTDTDVTAWIAQASELIDGYLASKYEVPVTGVNSLLILKMICILLVKSRILSVLSVKTPQDKNKQDPDGPTLYKQAMDLLKDIKKGLIQLSDATLSNSADGLTSYLKDQDIEYQFTMEDDAW